MEATGKMLNCLYFSGNVGSNLRASGALFQPARQCVVERNTR